MKYLFDATEILNNFFRFLILQSRIKKINVHCIVTK